MCFITFKSEVKFSEEKSEQLPYSTKEALKIYKIIEEIRKGNIKISELESKLSQVSDFLEKLTQ